MDVRKSLSVAFLSISDQYATFFIFFLQNGCRRQIHFRSHFWLFWINTDFLKKFFTKWLPVAILDVPKSLSILISGHFRSIHNFFCFEIFDKMAAVGYFGGPKFTLDHISGHFRSIEIYNFKFFFYKMAAGGHFGCPKITFDLISIHFTSI